MIAAPRTPTLSVVVNFHDMAREAPRTLRSLAPAYQRGVDRADYTVLAIDNGSSPPLDPALAASIDARFGHLRHEPRFPSPCAALNAAVAGCDGEFVMVCIDGARILSPGIVRHALAALRLAPHPFVYTLGMHLGPKVQNESMLEGYDQAREDALLATVDWEGDGYCLFGISSVALSSRRGFFSQLSESNCFALRREDYLALGGMDEAFTSAGGGLANLDFFNRVHEDARFQPVMLLGEATFHQFHGGTATNVPAARHPWPAMAAEYEAIRGRPFASAYRPPLYYGELGEQARHLLAG